MAGDDLLDCTNFFDQIDDFLDIPDDTSTPETDFLYKDFPSIWTHSDAFPDTNSASDNLSVPFEDIAQLEWLSAFVEDSFSTGNCLTIDVPSSAPSTVMSPSSTQFQTTSPVSVLESSSGSNYAAGRFMPVKPVATARCGRARTERPRPKTFKRRLVSPSASFVLEGEDSECDSFDEFPNSSRIRKSGSSTEKKKKKKVKLSVRAEVDQNDNPNALAESNTLGGVVRKCQHCEITKTPQWRAGPNGPKTLCNACGVRYKSGRLYPEYRPAASPTFVPSIHSNSHKKVLEMRVKICNNATGSPLIEDSDTEFVPNKSSLMDY